jgi:anti-anti-sigma factor
MTLSVNVASMINGVVVVSVRGEIDHSNAITLRNELMAVASSRRPAEVRVDLGLVTFLDSVAVGILVSARRAAAAEGVRVIVCRASPFVERQLRIAGVQDMLGLPGATGGDPLYR